MLGSVRLERRRNSVGERVGCGGRVSGGMVGVSGADAYLGLHH